MRVLLVWELGGQLGHFGILLPIADALSAEGHEVVFALKDLSYAHSLIGLRYRYYQAPPRVDSEQAARRYDSFADILLHAGFGNPDILGGLVSAWRTLYAQVQPDWVIYDYAPVALFAARGLPFKKTCVGTGFSNPPGSGFFPRFRYWQPDTEIETLHGRQSHQQAMANGNQIAQQLSMPLLECLPDIFTGAAQKLTTFPALDHYPTREGADYIGPFDGLGQGEPFNKQEGERWIFCYLWARHRGSLELLKALADIQAFKTLAVVPDLSSQLHTQQYKNLTITRQPIDLSTLSHWAELVVCHAGHGVLAQVTSQGIASVNVPVTLEQTMLAKRIEMADAGITLGKGVPPSHAARRIADAVGGHIGKAGVSRLQALHPISAVKSQGALLAALI